MRRERLGLPIGLAWSGPTQMRAGSRVKQECDRSAGAPDALVGGKPCSVINGGRLPTKVRSSYW